MCFGVDVLLCWLAVVVYGLYDALLLAGMAAMLMMLGLVEVVFWWFVLYMCFA